MAGVMSDFDRYLARRKPDPMGDGQPGPGRKRRLLHTVMLPGGVKQAGTARPSGGEET
jgi:hypothetical protein